MIQDIVLIPFPKQIGFNNGEFYLKHGQVISIPMQEKEIIFTIAKRLKEIIKSNTNLELPIYIGGKHGSEESIIFDKCPLISGEAYSIEINETQIKIKYGDAPGAFHAVSTMKQIVKQYKKKIPCLTIFDEPDFENRGIMIDISRNKIPTMDTLFSFIDFMSDIKLNQLQLYIEGFSFSYPTFPNVWESCTPITGEEIIEIDRYCKERFINLVPNQNSFGHMSAWLSRKEFAMLAESKKGYVDQWGVHEPAGTLNPLDPQSLELVKKLYNDLLPNFTSKFFNVGCDETFELGEGRSKEACEKFGVGRVYLDYLLKVYNLAKQQNKTMMFWGDIIIKYPEVITELPKDIIALEWGYEEDHPYNENCRKYKDAGIAFYVCPGTSSWNAISGRTDNMKANLLNAAIEGKNQGAEGFLNTDWGDNGHWQYQPVSYAGFVYGAGLSWNIQNNKDINVGAYLDEFIFRDKRKITTQNILDLGNYYLLEKHKTYNRTLIAQVLYSDINEMKPIEDLDESILSNIEVYIKKTYKRLEIAEMCCLDGVLVDEELRNTCRFVLHGVKLARFKIILKSKELSRVSDEFLMEMIAEIDEIMINHRKLWSARNRIGGLEESLRRMKYLKEQYEKYLMLE